MKRSAYSVNSSLTETTNNHSPKRSCTARSKLFVARFVNYFDFLSFYSLLLLFFCIKKVRQQVHARLHYLRHRRPMID